MNLRLEAAVTIRAPGERVWHIITDTRLWPVWGPSVRTVQCRDRFIAPGSKGYVRTCFGPRLSFAISDFKAERYWSWKVCGITATGHRVEALSRNRCRLVFDMPFLMAPYWGVCTIALRRIRHLAAHQRPAEWVALS